MIIFLHFWNTFVCRSFYYWLSIFLKLYVSFSYFILYIIPCLCSITRNLRVCCFIICWRYGFFHRKNYVCFFFFIWNLIVLIIEICFFIWIWWVFFYIIFIFLSYKSVLIVKIHRLKNSFCILKLKYLKII